MHSNIIRCINWYSPPAGDTRATSYTTRREKQILHLFSFKFYTRLSKIDGRMLIKSNFQWWHFKFPLNWILRIRREALTFSDTGNVKPSKAKRPILN